MSFNIYDILKNDTNVTNKLATYDLNGSPEPAIFNGTIIPKKYRTELTVNESTVNFYSTVPIDNTIKVKTDVVRLNCRAYQEPDAKALAKAVRDSLNDTFGGGIIYTTEIPGIPPRDDQDNFNYIIEATIKEPAS
jgi:hypothetical protein